MTRVQRRRWRLSAAPLAAGVARSMVEGVAGFLILFLPTAARGSIAEAILSLLAALWLVCWPAWRLRRIRSGRWWLRAGAGILRALAIGFVLAGIGVSFAAVLWRGVHPMGALPAAYIVVALTFVAVRPLVLALAGVRRSIRRRLRWQLMASHVAVIVLILTTMTAFGSVAAIQLLLFGTHPNASQMALTAADDLRFADNPQGNVLRTRAQRLFDSVGRGDVRLAGEPPLARISLRGLVPSRMLLVTLDGTILAGTRENQPATARMVSDIYGRPGLWRHLRALVLSGHHPDVTLPTVSGRERSAAIVAAAPLMDTRGITRAIVLVQVSRLAPSPTQLLQGTIAVFSVSTVALILASALPVLALSFLFAYLLARNLTRRLESVSRVTTAIAGGDLSQRASVGAPNEVGRLAADVNRMAANLEETVGELDAARDRAVDALRQRQELVASISHELRTPLAIVRAHLENLVARAPVLPGGTPPSDVIVPAPTLHALQSETERLSALVDDLFSLSRAEAGAVTVTSEPVDVAGLVDEIAGLMRPLVRQEGQIALAVEAQPGLPPALADADRLRQIISNLVRNAARHTSEGGIIVLSVAAEARWIVVAVADTGDGIAPEHLEHVFERFYRVDGARGRDRGGAGLGLAIVREFVELMGGRVTAESTPGEGTVFRVYLRSCED